MQTKLSWLLVLGAISHLLPSVAADGQLQDPNMYVVRDFNIVLTDNTKVSDLACCMGLSGEIRSAPEYQCFDHQDLQMGTAPGSRRVGIQFCHHLPGSDPQAATDAFNNVCKQGTGEQIQTDKNYCPQIWPNFKDDYKKPAPAAPPADDPKPAPAPTIPDATGKLTNDKDGFKLQGTFMYSLVDYSITRSLACCSGATAPILKPQKYKCAQRKVASSVFMSQCTSMLPTVTGAKKIHGYSTVNGDAGAIVDDKTKKACSDMWTNAVSYTYGFCKLDFDMAADDATTAFNADCADKGGQSKPPHNGMCLWNVDDAAPSS